MDQKAFFNEKDPWTWKTFTSLLLVEFIFVILFVKHGVQPFFEQWFDHSLYAGALTGVVIALVLTSGVYLIALRPKKLTWNKIGLRTFPPKDWFWIILWISLLMAGGFALIAIADSLGLSPENSKTDSLQKNVTPITIGISLISAAVISPVYEEIFYRGFLYRWLRTRTGVSMGILISSLIFTAAHYPTTNTMPINFMDGIVFAWAYEKTHSIWPGIIVHGFVNGSSILLLLLQPALL
ncbi:CPBP family intramembrane glutamic endopeptidase [Halobacillus massiliensis]|uniref:CPBP family intramembrane glutamic endopeptidase n=1 Tax=Halobacillus massiliensis TaxID=1926286 RepID=UPI0009E656F8|nr:type II CAAX endopeptidase family protein [Halobacillus massiliensis]